MNDLDILRKKWRAAFEEYLWAERKYNQGQISKEDLSLAKQESESAAKEYNASLSKSKGCKIDRDNTVNP